MDWNFIIWCWWNTLNWCFVIGGGIIIVCVFSVVVMALVNGIKAIKDWITR